MLLSSAGGFSVSGFRVEGFGVQASSITGIGLVVWALGFQACGFRRRASNGLQLASWTPWLSQTPSSNIEFRGAGFSVGCRGFR